jgi:hypothetical protein
MNAGTIVLKEKILKVEQDLAKIQTEQGSERQRVSMIDYLEYLKDELRMLEQNEHLRASNK